MAITMSLASALDAAPAQIGPVTPGLPSVPTTRSVPSLKAALRDIRRLGGTVTSETRTAPGIGSWVFIADAAGVEVVLWENAPAIGS
jgi:predicted enzyme related to lactoylglutathione lyase